MIRKWVKLLPYWLVMKLCRSDGAHWGIFEGRKVRYFQIHEGEIVLFSPETQKIFDERKIKQRKEKLEIKKDKIMKKINKDFGLKEKIIEEFKDEEERKKEAMEGEY